MEVCYEQMFSWCLLIICLNHQISECLIQYEIAGGCNDIEGTWKHVTAEHTSYYRLQRGSSFISLAFTPRTTSQSAVPGSRHSSFPFNQHLRASPDTSTITYDIPLEEFFSVPSISTEGCSLLLGNGSMFVKVQNINHVHLIFMNHLDVGYTTNQPYPGTDIRMPGYITNVLNWYFQHYFPTAAQLGDDLRAIGAKETFIYTTHPWLINIFLDCPKITLSGVELQCPTEEQKETFRRAVWMGDIAWHAGPLNLEPEASNPDLFSYSLTLSEKLDDYFGLKKKARTLSQRDVPGMTQAAIPYMVERNIVAASFGVNGGSAPPDVPSPNVWRFGKDSIITYWHKGGYPNAPGTSPANPGGLRREDCQFVDGLDHVLCFAFNNDNTGPPVNVSQITTFYNILRSEFPGAEIKASTFDDFTSLLLPIKHKLPVITGEIGDTWIQGPASDPIKMSHYRVISRMRSECLREKQCDPTDKRIDDMSRLLIKLPEHTYGMYSVFDWVHWTNEEFQPLQYLAIGYRNDSMSWLSHRLFNDVVIDALEKHPLADKIKAELSELLPVVPNLDDYKTHNISQAISCSNGMILRIGPNGDLVQLSDLQGRNWADDDNPLARILYRTYNSTDYDINHSQYDWNSQGRVFRKPDLNKYSNAQSRFWDVNVQCVYVAKIGDPCNAGIVAHVVQSDMETWFNYGAPTSYFLKYITKNDGLDIEYQFFNKPATRLPEAMFLHFQPSPHFGHEWFVHKLGYFINSTDVVNNGSQYVHGVDRGVAYLDANSSGLIIESRDVATVAVATSRHEPSPFPYPLDPMPVPPNGMAFNFFNNIWETNFILWYPYQPQDKHYKARFHLSFQ